MKSEPKGALTAKQEKFCQAVVSGLNISDAYRSAYDAGGMKPATVNRSAKELTDNPKIAARVQALRKPVVEEVQYGLKQAMSEAQQAFDVALEKGNGGAMVAAATLRAKLNGLLVERKEIRTGPLDGLPTDELEAMENAISVIQRARSAVA